VSDEPLLDVAVAVADGVAIDWASASQTLGPAGNADDQELLDGLKLIADITAARGTTLVPPSPIAAPDGDGQSVPAGGAAPPDERLEQWGPLTIIEQVGRGTFGDLYRAWDTRLDREVALKILRRCDSTDAAAGSTIIEEARLLARVHHPNVVTVYGAERIGGRIGLWMEFVHGNTLETELAERGPFDVEQVIEIAVALGGALAAVHQAGLLHHDVKTHNVMRDRDGRILLTDFGAGELMDAQAGHPGSAIGTPLYAAPEVLTGQPATRQSDIYSLGVLLYRLTTGRYPIEGRTLEEVRAAHAQGTRTSLRAARPDMPDGFVTAIERTVDPDAGSRYQTAEALRDAFASLGEHAMHASRFVGTSITKTWPRRLALGASALVLMSLASAAVFSWRQPPRPLAIAVLPLENLGADAHGDEVADGLTDEIIRQLTTIQGLDVRSRTSSFAFKGRPLNLRETAKQLQANLLLEGSVQRSDGRIRINAQLVRASDDATVWAGKFDRDIKDILAIQEEISRSIVGELRLKLDPNPRRYDIDVTTYERYLRARSLSERNDRDNLRTAIAFYKEVVASAPQFAPAYAGLADAYADLEFWGVNFEDTYSQVKAAAAKALELDPLSPEAHAAMGLVYARDRQWASAEKAFERSIEINPNLSRTHTAYAFWVLFQSGKLNQALQELQVSMRIDPLSLDLRRRLAYVQISAGQYEAALDNCRYVLKSDPMYPLIRLVLARALVMTGNSAEAIRVLEPMGANRAPELPFAYASVGRIAEAEALAAAAESAPLTQAVIFAGLQDKDRAFAALERAAAVGDPKIGGALTYPELAVLRDDARFAAFRQRIGLDK
jgi:serine/threonine protein kinase/tetratricopeptide (TPR) repeat protein